MTIEFDRPVGAPADVKELEYVSALSQTSMPDLRTNGSLYVEDILCYLTSRHGIRADPEVVEEDIMTDLAGDLSSDASQVIDICQMASILLLPHVKKIADSNDEAQIQQLFGKGLELILAEVPLDNYNATAPILSVDLLQTILHTHGEHQVPAQVLEDMVRVAGGEGQVLDVTTLMKAMTFDLAAYDVSRESMATTHYQDAMVKLQSDRNDDEEEDDQPSVLKQGREDGDNRDEENHPTKVVDDDNNMDGNETEKEQEQGSRKKKERQRGRAALKRIFTASTLDLTAETYGNKVWVGLCWVTAVLMFFSFLFRRITKVGRPKCTELSHFSCKLVSGVVQWLIIFAQLSILGSGFIALASMGNSVYNRFGAAAIVSMFVGAGTIALTSIFTFFQPMQNRFFTTIKYEGFEIGNYAILAIGITMITFQFVELLRIMLPAKFAQSIPRWEQTVQPGTFKLERATKQAAAYKVDRMIHNALSIHESTTPNRSGISANTVMGSTLLVYQVKEHEVEPCGGILWAWKRIYDGSIYHDEGVWLHARLIASNIAQVFVAATFCVGWGLIYFRYLNNDDPIATSPPSMSPSAHPTVAAIPSASPSMSFFPSASPSMHPSFNHSSVSPVAAPTRSSTSRSSSWSGFNIRHGEINAAVTIGAIFAVAACLSIVLTYLPSAISTILKFRSGFSPSLRSKEFLKYRFAPDQTTSLLGSAFWGAMYATLVCWVIATVIVYVLISKNTRSIFIFILAQVSGIVITLIVKMLVMIVLRQQFFAAFYRKQPGAANIMLTMLECWNVSLSTLYMITRSAILIIIAALFIARIDTPVLAPGIGQIGPVMLDGGPFAFCKDLLVHDAHRHPYIERLGFMYMLKLRHGDSFASRAGSCWRLLFTIALMPWLRKYRILSYNDSLGDKTTENEQVLENTHALRKIKSNDAGSNEAMEQENQRFRERILELEEEIARLKQECLDSKSLTTSGKGGTESSPVVEDKPYEVLR